MSTPEKSVPVRLIHTQGPDPTPSAYKVPGSQEIQLSSVTAQFDNSSGQTIDPTLSLYSQDGQLLSRTKPGGAGIADGNAGVVTWIPFLRQAATNTGGGISDLFTVYNSVDQTVNDGASKNLTFDSASLSIGSPFTTPNNIEFDCAAGAWLFGVQLLLAGSNTGTSGEFLARIRDLTGPTDFAIVRLDSDADVIHTITQTVAASAPWDGTSTAPSIEIRVTNTLGYNVLVKGGIGTSIFWGVRLLNA